MSIETIWMIAVTILAVCAFFRPRIVEKTVREALDNFDVEWALRNNLENVLKDNPRIVRMIVKEINQYQVYSASPIAPKADIDES